MKLKEFLVEASDDSGYAIFLSAGGIKNIAKDTTMTIELFNNLKDATNALKRGQTMTKNSDSFTKKLKSLISPIVYVVISGDWKDEETFNDLQFLGFSKATTSEIAAKEILAKTHTDKKGSVIAFYKIKNR